MTAGVTSPIASAARVSPRSSNAIFSARSIRLSLPIKRYFIYLFLCKRNRDAFKPPLLKGAGLKPRLQPRQQRLHRPHRLRGAPSCLNRGEAFEQAFARRDDAAQRRIEAGAHRPATGSAAGREREVKSG